MSCFLRRKVNKSGNFYLTHKVCMLQPGIHTLRTLYLENSNQQQQQLPRIWRFVLEVFFLLGCCRLADGADATIAIKYFATSPPATEMG